MTPRCSLLVLLTGRSNPQILHTYLGILPKLKIGDSWSDVYGYLAPHGLAVPGGRIGPETLESIRSTNLPSKSNDTMIVSSVGVRDIQTPSVVRIAEPAKEVSRRWFNVKLLPTDCSPEWANATGQ